MSFRRVALVALPLLFVRCDFGIDTKGLAGDAAPPDDVSQGDDAADEATPDVVAPTVLLGDSDVEGIQGSSVQNAPDGYRFVASSSGNATAVWIYVDAATDSAATLDVGIYDDDSSTTPSQPKSLLAQASFGSVTPDSWNSQTIPSTAITSGSTYWIVVLSKSGTFYYRNAGGTSGSLESVSSSATSLPSTWAVPTTKNDGPASMYLTP